VDLSPLINYGPLGIIVILFLVGWVWAKPAVDSLRRDKEKAEDQRDALIKVFETQVIPVLDDVATQVVPTLLEIRDDVKELKAKLP
jgi:hypothetical protein